MFRTIGSLLNYLSESYTVYREDYFRRTKERIIISVEYIVDDIAFDNVMDKCIQAGLVDKVIIDGKITVYDPTIKTISKFYQLKGSK